MYQFWQIQHVKSQQEHLVTEWQGKAMIRLASDKRYSKHGSAMVLIIVRLYHLKQKMKIRKPSKNEAPRLPNSTFRTRGLTRSSPANLSSPALVIPSPSVIIHPPLHACSSWSKDYLGNSPHFPCCLQGRSQLWSICYKSVLCKKCALTVRLTHRGGPFSAGNHC